MIRIPDDVFAACKVAADCAALFGGVQYLPPQSAVFRFLCAVEEQDGAEAIYWRWGPLGSLRRLPRVKIGSVVVCRAYWHLTPDQVPCDGSERGERQAIDRWRADENVPRFIIVAEEDRELFVDLDQPLYVRMRAGYLRRRGRAFVYEMLPGPDELCLTSPEGTFTNDIILPCVASPERRARPYLPAERARDVAADVPCRHGIGSEWLYARLAVARRYVEMVLVEEIAPLMEALRSAGRIDTWYSCATRIRSRTSGCDVMDARKTCTPSSCQDSSSAWPIWRGAGSLFRRRVSHELRAHERQPAAVAETWLARDAPLHVLGLYYRSEIEQRVSPAGGVTPRLRHADDARPRATSAGV